MFIYWSVSQKVIAEIQDTESTRNCHRPQAIKRHSRKTFFFPSFSPPYLGLLRLRTRPCCGELFMELDNIGILNKKVGFGGGLSCALENVWGASWPILTILFPENPSVTTESVPRYFQVSLRGKSPLLGRTQPRWLAGSKVLWCHGSSTYARGVSEKAAQTGKLPDGRCAGEAAGCLVLLNSKYCNSHSLEKVVQKWSNLTGARKQSLYSCILPVAKFQCQLAKKNI